MGIVLVDGQEIEVGDQERLNGIQVARRAGVDVPHYCWHPGLTVVASCRMCLVETGTRNPQTGAVTMMPKLVPACQTPAKDGTVFLTTGPKIDQARAFVEEQLLIDHPIDCPICDKAGECYLQDYYFEYGQDQRRADIHPFTSRRREMGSTVTLFVDRCVMCTRCVRFTREVSGSGELMVTNRGSHEEIDVLPGFPLENKMSGNVVDLCPVGALGDRDFLYKQRVWFMKKHEGICTRCSTGCNINIEENQDVVYRLKPRENLAVNKWWMCDEGRYGYHYVHSPERVVGARHRDGDTETLMEWSRVAADLPNRLAQAGRLAALVSPHLTVEEAYLLAKFIRSIDPQALLGVGPIPVRGQDERFKSGFIIHAEKCPNRLGVEAVVSHFGGALTFDKFRAQVAEHKPGGLWITAGYPEGWPQDAAIDGLTAPLTIVQDIFTSPLWEAATYQLPGATYPERDGSYVNFAHRLQKSSWAIRPPAGVWSEGQLYWRLLGGVGLYQSGAVRQEVAMTISYFSAAAGDVPTDGVDLRINQLAAAT